MANTVNHPPHYGGDTTYEHWRVAVAWKLTPFLYNCTKYICRQGRKRRAASVEDLKKARWYLDKAIEAATGTLPMETKEG